MATVKIKVDGNGTLPSYQHSSDSGVDIHSACGYIIAPRSRQIIRTGLHVQIPDGYEIQLRGRSGLAAKYGIIAHMGTIDSGFLGEIQVILFNTTDVPIHINHGDRIAQAVLCPIEKIVWDIETPFDETDRGGNGLGSSGV